MRYLIAETVGLKPHLETAGEIALTLRDQGHQAVYSWLGDDLPWSDWHLPPIAKILGCSLAKRQQRFARILAREGIQLTPPSPPDAKRMNAVMQWANAFDGDIDALKNYSYEGIRLGMGAASSLISLSADSQYDPSRNLPLVRQCLASVALVYERARQVIAAVKPDTVITFNGRFATAKPIILAAQAAGIPVLRHERGATFARYDIFTDAMQNYVYIRQRILEAWEQADTENRERLGHDYFQRRRKGDGVGWYSYTTGQEQGQIPPRVPGKRRVVFFSSSADEFACASDEFVWETWPDQLKAVHTLLEIANAQSDIELILRIHPNLASKSLADQKRWMAFAGMDGIQVIGAQDKTDTYALMDSADIVISYGSRTSIEAAYWGKPSISLGPSAYSGGPAVQEPKTPEALADLLRPGHTPPLPDQADCLSYGYYSLTHGTPFRFYQPQSLSEGTFLGDRLGWDPDFVHWLRQQTVIKKVSRYLRRRT